VAKLLDRFSIVVPGYATQVHKAKKDMSCIPLLHNGSRINGIPNSVKKCASGELQEAGAACMVVKFSLGKLDLKAKQPSECEFTRTDHKQKVVELP